MRSYNYFVWFCTTAIMFYSCSRAIKVQESVKKEFINKTQIIASEVNEINYGNIGILIKYKEDTLNRETLINNNVTITNISILSKASDSLSGKLQESAKKIDTLSLSNKQSFLALLFCKAQMKFDTLVLDLSLPLNQIISYKIIKNNVNGIYKEIYKTAILKSSTTGLLTNNIELNMQEQAIIVNNTKFLTGNMIYGKAHLKTGIFYIKDDNFKDGFLKKQIYMEYLFRVKIN